MESGIGMKSVSAELSSERTSTPVSTAAIGGPPMLYILCGVECEQVIRNITKIVIAIEQNMGLFVGNTNSTRFGVVV